MTTLAVGVPGKAKVTFTMHSTRLVLNIGGRQVSTNPYSGSKAALMRLAMVRSVAYAPSDAAVHDAQ